MLINSRNKSVIELGILAIGFNCLVLSLYLSDHIHGVWDLQKAHINSPFIPFGLRDHPPTEAEYSYICATCASLPPRGTRYYTGPTNFIWPVYSNDRVVGEYDDPDSQGLLIEAPVGTPVKASDDGEVIQASYSDKLGMLVFIRHPNGFISYYGYNSEVGVKKGSKVVRGQVIAKSGTRITDGAHLLLFGLRHPDIQPTLGVINPRAYL
jgi:hypothetical protein